MLFFLYRRLLEVPFLNTSDLPVSYIEVLPKAPLAISGKSKSKNRSRWLSVNCEDIQGQLPVQPESSLTLPVIMKTEAKLDNENTGKQLSKVGKIGIILKEA